MKEVKQSGTKTPCYVNETEIFSTACKSILQDGKSTKTDVGTVSALIKKTLMKYEKMDSIFHRLKV